MTEEKSVRSVSMIFAALLFFCIAAVGVSLFVGGCQNRYVSEPLFAKGMISIKSPGADAWVPLSEDTVITEGCEIMTGEESSLELRLPGDSIIKVGENSHIRFNTLENIEVTRIARSDIDVLYGKMRAFVLPFRDNESSFIIRSGHSAIGVRGTDFGVIASRDESTTEVLCLDGEVLVSATDEAAEWEPVVVAANLEVVLADDTPVSEPTPLDEAKREAFLAEMALESRGETESLIDDAPVEPAPEEDAALHEVQPGDTLWDLAARYYGDAHQYPVLFDANRDSISEDDLIYPGQVLQIP